jgi:hypothetical protein
MILLAAVVSFLPFEWLSWLFERKQRAAQPAAAAAFENRHRTPDLAAVKRHFGHTLPKGLHALYANQILISSQDVIVSVPNPALSEEG